MFGFRRRPENFKQTRFRALLKVSASQTDAARQPSPRRGNNVDAPRQPRRRAAAAISDDQLKNSRCMLVNIRDHVEWFGDDFAIIFWFAIVKATASAADPSVFFSTWMDLYVYSDGVFT